MEVIILSICSGTIHYDRFMSGKWQCYRTLMWDESSNGLVGKGRNQKEALKDLKNQEKKLGLISREQIIQSIVDYNEF